MPAATGRVRGRWPRRRQGAGACSRLQLPAGGGLDRRPAGRGPAARPRPRRAAPRHQAVQHPARRRRPADAARLQPGPGQPRRPGQGRPRRHDRLHGPRAPPSLAARDPAMARQVDHRADIYSLGMVLFEMLVGRSPFAAECQLHAAAAADRGHGRGARPGGPVAAASAPDVPWGLESIVRKCLAPTRRDRYQQAEHLAEDLRRFLDDRPLRHAPELSLRERCRSGAAAPAPVHGGQCRHRRRLAGVYAGRGPGGLAASARHDPIAARPDAGTPGRAQAQERKRAFRAGTIRAPVLVNTTTDGHDQLQAGRRGMRKALGLYEVLQRDDWQQRRLALPRRNGPPATGRGRPRTPAAAGVGARLGPRRRRRLRNGLSPCWTAARPSPDWRRCGRCGRTGRLYLDRLGETDRPRRPA